MKLIPLTQGKFAQVDDEDFEWLMQWKWYCSNGYAARGEYHKESQTMGKIWMHREIMHTPDGMDTDHRDGRRANNQRENLRVCTQSENLQNTCARKMNKSGYKGVSWHEKGTKGRQWRAVVCGKEVGHFADPVEAARAYDKAARERYGEFARLNFPDL